uniref:Cyclin dependent kinase 9 n=1 Tax=Echinococcus granulosus TaxID=6210 RepID=A0A068WEG7_ECHGR|nr:cyclin dependent kinase 9 [Echinococcus granulosus]
MPASIFSEPSLSASMVEDLEADYSGVFRNIEDILSRLPNVSPVDRYERLQKIGQGTFGEVFKARHRMTKQHFALKRIRMEQEKEGQFKFPITAIREIRILQSLQHENIVCLKDVCYNTRDERSCFRPQFFLVFEFCDHDLAGLSQRIDFSNSVKKAIMLQLLKGLFYLHKNNVLHRDLKAANILINRNGVLKIADFGLARRTVASTRPDRPPRYTGRVVTLWYRPPEILLNDRNYGKPVDMWGAGCIMAELWTKFPIMQGDNELAQLKLIINLCGSINSEVWPGVERLDAFRDAQLPRDIKRHVRERLKDKVSSPTAIDLIDKLLVIDPSKRFTADQALSHDYFYEDPPPGDLKVLSREGTSYLEFFSNPRHSRGVQQQHQQLPQAHHNYHGGHHMGTHQRPGPYQYHPGAGRVPMGQVRRPLIPDDNIHHDRIY